MFKVQENGDGSTSIFCNNTGTLICTIRSQQRNLGVVCRPVNVVEPSPQPRSHVINSDLKSDSSSDEDQKSSSKRRCISPLPDEPKEDFYEDCITPEEFARCLNLVPRKQYEETPLDQIYSSFPLRHHSRTKSVRISEDIHDLKIPDDLPLTSSLGVKLLNLNSPKNFYCDQTIAQKIKNYDSFCRFQLNTSSVYSNFPKLRCREKKDYPVYVSQKFSKCGFTHIYTFNKRQRLEKMITFKTGLSYRSRKLLQKCKQRLAVCLKRLSGDEIQIWLSKKSSIVRPITLDCIKDEPILICSDSESNLVQDYPASVPYDCLESSSSSSSSSSDDSDYQPVNVSLPNKVVSFKGVLNNPGTYLSPTKSDKYLSPSKSKNFLSPSKFGNSSHLKHRNARCSRILNYGSLQYKDSFVRMDNVLRKICKYSGKYYIRGTSICVPFLAEYLCSLKPKDLNLVLDIDACLSPSSSLVFNAHCQFNSSHDHAYHLPIPKSFSLKEKSTTDCHSKIKRLKVKSDSNQHFKASNNIKKRPNILTKLNNVKNSSNSPVDKLKIVPIIDLTKDSPPKKQRRKQRWIFKCHGCNFKKIFSEDFGIRKYGVEHLIKFHCVTAPESFLSVCHDDPSLNILEAFPGYKDNEET